MKKIIFSLALLSFILTGCNLFSGDNSLTIQTSKGDQTLSVEIADETEEHIKGYMDREEIPEGTGMWFVFKKEQSMSYWMKSTLVPLDIIYVNKDLVIDEIVANAPPCEGDPCTKYYSQKPAQYVLEVPGGYAEKAGIEIGNSIIPPK